LVQSGTPLSSTIRIFLSDIIVHAFITEDELLFTICAFLSIGSVTVKADPAPGLLSTDIVSLIALLTPL
jgi:hypothetical protein